MRIMVVSAYGYWGDFSPTDLTQGTRQVGGGETAMVNVSKELAALGHDVIVFYDVAEPGRYDGVDYLPTALYVPLSCNLHSDVLVSWDAPFAFRFADRATKRVLAFQLNDASVGALDWTIDYYFHPSRWHMERFWGLYPELSHEKCYPQMTNGINYGRYAVDHDVRNPNRVIYSSSPDRGLHHLLSLWPKVVEAVPAAELHVFYDMDKWLATLDAIRAKGGTTVTSDRGEIIKQYRLNPPPNVYFHGGVGQSALAREQMKSAVMAYPCDPVQPTEGFSMSILEGIAAGCNVITTDADALKELWGQAPGVTILPNPVDSYLWTQTIVAKLRATDVLPTVQINTQYSWATIARRWEEILC